MAQIHVNLLVGDSKVFKVLCKTPTLPGFRWLTTIEADDEGEALEIAKIPPHCDDSDPYCLVVQAGTNLIKFQSWQTLGEAEETLRNFVSGQWALIRSDSQISGLVICQSDPPLTVGRVDPGLN